MFLIEQQSVPQLTLFQVCIYLEGGGIKVLSQSKDEHRGHSKDFTKERQVREAASLLPFILLKSTFGHLT